MGILGALSTSVSGLAAQSYALENISGNIANSSTIGYKRVNTNFVDFVANTVPQHETAGSVLSFSALTNNIQGTTQTTGVSTNMALSGDGFFAVSKNIGTTASPSFSGSSLYTRRGDFSTDANGYLVNGAGYFLNGSTYNPATGAVTTAGTLPIKVSDVNLPAVATTQVNYSGNLPTVPKTGKYNTSSTGVGSTATESFTALSAGQTSTFTVDGTSVTLANSAGTASTADYTFAAPSSSTNVTIGGQTITVGSTDTLSSVITAINASGGTVTASDDGGSLKLTNNTAGSTAVTAPSDSTLFASSGTSATGTAAVTTGSSAANAATAIQSALTAAGDTNVTASAVGTGLVFTRTSHDTSAAAVPTGVTGTNPFGAATTTVGSSDATYLIDANDFNSGTNPVTGTAVLASDNTAFLNETISGGEVVVYNQTGTATTLQTRWAKVTDEASGTPATWKLFYESNATATGGAVQWKEAGTATFNASGVMTSPTSPSSFSISGLSIDGTAIGDVTMNLSGGLTQYSDSNGTVTSSLTQDGSAIGVLSSVAVSSDGTVTGTYSNGKAATLASVSVAHFADPNGLQSEDGGTYAQTLASGSPSYGLGTSTLTGGAVEESNTDISDEFSKMIVTQQAYSANTKVMTTAQSMLQDILNIVR